MGLQEPEHPRTEALAAELREMGRIITGLREERGMSREELAQRCEMTVPELEEIERGEREETWGSYRKLAEGLDMRHPDFIRALEEVTSDLGGEEWRQRAGEAKTDSAEPGARWK